MGSRSLVNGKKSLTKSGQECQQLPTWILVWFYVTAAICTWDATFIMLRPHSLPGGSYAWIWYLYKYYVAVDQRYKDMDDSFVFAQSLLNYAEVIFNIITIILHYKRSRHTAISAFTVSVMTMWKTLLYFLMFTDFCTGGVYRKDNSVMQEILLVVIPNIVWIILPSAAMAELWHKLVKVNEQSEGHFNVLPKNNSDGGHVNVLPKNNSDGSTYSGRVRQRNGAQAKGAVTTTVSGTNSYLPSRSEQ